MTNREHLIQVSYEYFLSHGYLNTTIKDILTVAKVSRGGFYHHFQSKDELLIEVIKKYYLDQINESLSILSSCNSYGDFLDRLLKIFKEFTSMNEENKTILYSISFMLEAVKEVPAASDFMEKMFKEILVIYTEFIEKQKIENEIRKDVDAEETAKFLITIIEGFYVMSAYFTRDWSGDYVFSTLKNHYDTIKE